MYFIECPKCGTMVMIDLTSTIQKCPNCSATFNLAYGTNAIYIRGSTSSEGVSGYEIIYKDC